MTSLQPCSIAKEATTVYQHPGVGLSLLNLSLDTLKPDRFEQMTRRRGHDRVLETLDLALRLGFSPVKVRVQCITIADYATSLLLRKHVIGVTG